MARASQSHVAMRPLTVIATVALLALAGGTTATALELPALEAVPLPQPLGPDLGGPLPPAPDAAAILPETPIGEPTRGSPGLRALPPAKAVVATTAIGGALALVAFALYSRLGRNDLLDHERRDEVFQLVRAQPGVSLTEVAQATGLGWGTTVYHLDRLERAGFVTSERAGGRRRYFPVGAVAKDARAPLCALQQDTTRSVASFVVERPGSTQAELAEALGMSASATSKQISKLESVGLVRREREWKTVRLHPEPQLRELVCAPSQPAIA